MSREIIEKIKLNAKAALLDRQAKAREREKERDQNTFNPAKDQLIKDLQGLGIEIDESKVAPLIAGSRWVGAIWKIDDLQFSTEKPDGHSYSLRLFLRRFCPRHKQYSQKEYICSLADIGEFFQKDIKTICPECKTQTFDPDKPEEKQPRIMSDAEGRLIDAIYELTYRGEF